MPCRLHVQLHRRFHGFVLDISILSCPTTRIKLRGIPCHYLSMPNHCLRPGLPQSSFPIWLTVSVAASTALSRIYLGILHSPDCPATFAGLLCRFALGVDMRPSGRNLDEVREVSIETGVLMHAEGSCLISCGDTRVLCAATIMPRVPPFRRNSGLGWITAEYAVLPRATIMRNRRESHDGRPSGRTMEIQRFVGRSLRSCMDAAALG